MGYFPKRLTHDFGQKFELSSLCVFIETGLEMMFGDVLETKEAVLHNINTCVLYSRKIGYFVLSCPNGLNHDFGKKFELSSWCIFIENTPRNDVRGCSRKKRSLSTQYKYIWVFFHDFGQEFELCLLLVFIENRRRNDVWGCSRYKRSLSRLQK